jgi:hypothetical protein
VTFPLLSQGSTRAANAARMGQMADAARQAGT